MEKSCCGPSSREADRPARRTVDLPTRTREQTVEREKAEVVWLDGGRTYIGARSPLIPEDGEGRRDVRLKPFGIERFAVTNRRFAAFVEATGYTTEAERFGWSFVVGGWPATFGGRVGIRGPRRRRRHLSLGQ